jgi:hypothetical protein
MSNTFAFTISQLMGGSPRLAFTVFRRENSPISTRIELGCLGLAGTLWLGTQTFTFTPFCLVYIDRYF